MSRPFRLDGVVRPVRPAERPLRIGFLSSHNPLDRRAFSGTAFHAARALEARGDIELEILGNHAAPRRVDRLLRRTPARFGGPIALGGLDAVIGLVATDLLERLAPRLAVPFLHVTDATPAFLREAYGWHISQTAEAAEARVVAAAAATVYSSEAMRDRARRDFGVAAARALALPFGTNLDIHSAGSSVKPPLDRLELLFVASDWRRKGGDIAVAALERLIAAGRPARLTVVGAAPRAVARHPGVRAIGYLDPARPGDARRLSRLYGRAHLMVLPTRADCTPMVVAEALAHGTPVLATDTGGLATLLPDGGPGRRLPLAAGPDAWACAIREMTRDPARLAALSEAAARDAARRLDWATWAAGLRGLLDAVLATPWPRRHAA